MSTDKRSADWLIMLSIAGVSFLTLFLYRGVQDFSFLNFDDNVYVLDNSFVRSGLRLENIRWAFTHFHGGHWHPLSWISHMIDCQIFGLDSSGPHIVNSVFHALNTTLFFLLLFNLLENVLISLLGALFFAVHPMRMEAVAWVTERKELCAALFGLLTLLFYLNLVKKPNFKKRLAVALTFSIGLMCKPTLVILPCLLLLLDFWPLQRKQTFKKLLFEKWPLFLVSFASSGITILAQKAGGGFRTAGEISFADRLSTVPVAYLSYLGKFFWPTGFGIFYPFQSFPPGVGAGAWFSIILITFLCFQNRIRWPQLLFGWFWFLISLVTVVGFIQVGGQSVADRWTYLAHMGLILALGGICSNLSKKVQQGLTAPVLIAITICFYITAMELPTWKNSISIFRRTLLASPENFMAHTNLGQALTSQGKLNEAAFHFEEAVRLNPYFSVALNNLGFLRAKQGRVEEAKTLFLRALERQPDYPQAKKNLALLIRNQSACGS